MGPSLQIINWESTSGPRRLLVAGHPWLSQGLLDRLQAAEIESEESETEIVPNALVVERSSLHLVPEETIRSIDWHVLIDVEDFERWRVSGIKAGQSRARVVLIPSLAAAGAAEQAMLLILALSRRLLAGYSAVVDGSWADPISGPMLAGRTLGIVGLGRSGVALAKRAFGFGMRVLFHDIVDRSEISARLPVVYRRLDQILRESDVVSLNLPAGPETFRLIDAPELAAMKPTALLINIADGRLIDEGSLIKALRHGDIGGAGLDTFAYEPLPPDSPLIGFENVVLTPRSAWMNPEDERRAWLSQIVAQLAAND